MKNTVTIRRTSNGITFIELTAIILVIMSCASFLILAARARVENGRKEECINNQRNVQQRIRAYQLAHGLKPGDKFNEAEFLIDSGLFQFPVCPSCNHITTMEPGIIPERGTAYMWCDWKNGHETFQHEPPGSYTGW